MNMERLIKYLITSLTKISEQIKSISSGVLILLIFFTDGSKSYNCSIIDLYDRSIIASLTGRNTTAELAKLTMQKALDSQPGMDTTKFMLHSDQGSQYTSKEFTEFCERLGITQSMSKAGYPYDNAPIERYFNTLKNDLINQHYYHTEEELYTAVEEFAYVQYNHVRPHSYNDYKTPYEARYWVTYTLSQKLCQSVTIMLNHNNVYNEAE